MPESALSQRTSLDAAALRDVDRAVADLRRGGTVLIVAGTDLALVQAAEAVTPDSLAQLTQLAGAAPRLALTGRRAGALGLIDDGVPAVSITLATDISAHALHSLADPTAGDPIPAIAEIEAAADDSLYVAAVQLAKLARLLPAALVARPAQPPKDLRAWMEAHHLIAVESTQIRTYAVVAARSLERVSEAHVPLIDAEDCRVISFRPSDGGIEHLAILIGAPNPAQPVLTRLHSECFTGDLLGSLRCDCGDQLRGALAEIAAAGAGVLIYLAQEGRGIGLVNKLRAYKLQDEGFDTFDANQQLGFDDDERIFLPAAEILRRLGFNRVRLLTNNPRKVKALRQCGIDVSERVPHVFPSNGHSERYLDSKARRAGHFF